MADSKEQNTEDLPSEVPSPGESRCSTETSEACSPPQESEESSQKTEPEISNQQESEESSRKTKTQTSKAETEPELVVESTSYVVTAPETVSRTDASSTEEEEFSYINVITRSAQQILGYIKQDMAWSVFIGALTVLGSVCIGLAGVFVTFAVTFLCAGATVLFGVCTACGVRLLLIRKNVQSSGSEQILLEGGLRQSPGIRAPVIEQPPSSQRSNFQFPWSSIDTGVRAAFRWIREHFGIRQEEFREEHQQQSRRTRIYQDPPTESPEVIFERGAVEAAGSSVGIFERDVTSASGSSVGIFERDVTSASGSSVGIFERDVTSASGSSVGIFERDVTSASGSSVGIFERDVASASGSSVGLFERDVAAASGSSVGPFERDVASSPAVGPFELDFASSSSGSSNVMVVQADVHREESSEDTIVEPNFGDGGNDEKSQSSRGSDDEPER